MIEGVRRAGAMDIADQVESLAAMMDTLMFADEVPNTFGLTHQVAAALRSLSATLTPAAPHAVKARLDEVLRRVEENRALFAIPETRVVEDVYENACQVRGKLGRGPFM
jgi:hypothetical protein